MSFENLIPHSGILSAIDALGYKVPTPIQEQAIPQVIQGLDILASAQTGTGKTAAFLLPALLRLSEPSKVQGIGPRILVLVPTRELAMQVADEAKKFSKNLSKTKTVCIYGGMPYPAQIKDLSRPYEILVATPGRLIDHMERGKINFSRIEMLVLDEADRMLDMGFIEDVEQIANNTPKGRQTLLFSATMKGAVLGLSKRLLKSPIEIRIEPKQEKHENIDQKVHMVDNLDHKYRLLSEMVSDPSLSQILVFTSTKRQADTLASQLCQGGHLASVLHGDMRQRQRTKTIQQFRESKIRILVATDVAARGIDIPTISHVINFDLPHSVEDYVHRIGRTGRAGAKGTAFSFVTKKDIQLVRRIERFIGKKIIHDEITQESPARKKPNKPYQEKKANKSSRPQQRSFSPRQKEFHKESHKESHKEFRKDFHKDFRRDSFEETKPKKRFFRSSKNTSEQNFFPPKKSKSFANRFPPKKQFHRKPKFK